MNKILNINLGGYALTIDDDAYNYLSAYLESIRRRFSESEGRDEILRDIESRLGEIISTSMGNRTIVMLPDVEAATEVMGKPEDFGGEPVEKSGAGPSHKKTFQPGKKLYRDEDDSVISGVCSGLAAYFGIRDAVWMRLIFVVLALISFGFWVPAYILLWILVPPARTAAERLAMRGETPNVENIAREIEQGFERISKKVNDFGAQDTVRSAGRTTANVAAGCLSVIGKLFLGLMIFIAVVLMLALGTAWVTGIWAVFTAQPYIAYFSPLSSGATSLAIMNAFFVLGIPVVGLVMWLGRTIFRFKSPAWLGTGMGLLWVLNFISLVMLGGVGFSRYRQSSTVSHKLDMRSLRADTLRVEWVGMSGPGDDNGHWIIDEEGIRIGNNSLEMNGPLRINILRSESGQFEVTQAVHARGASANEAADNAREIKYDIRMEGNILRVPSGYTLEAGKKWSIQEIAITIRVPVGKSIVLGKEVNERVRTVDVADPDNEDYWITDNPDKVYRMTQDGLVCSDCPQFGDRNFRSGRSYEKFILEGNFETEIIKDDDFSVEFEGAQGDRNAIETIRSGDNLTLTTRGRNLNGSVRCVIHAPVFTSLYADNTGPVTLRGFDEGRASITAKGGSRIKGYLECNDMTLSLAGKSTLELIGNGNDLNATLADGAELEASGWRVSHADVSASDGSRARVNVDGSAVVRADASSNVKVDGNAQVERK